MIAREMTDAELEAAIANKERELEEAIKEAATIRKSLGCLKDSRARRRCDFSVGDVVEVKSRRRVRGSKRWIVEYKDVFTRYVVTAIASGYGLSPKITGTQILKSGKVGKRTAQLYGCKPIGERYEYDGADWVKAQRRAGV